MRDGKAVLVAIVLLAGCCNPGDEPKAPYGAADDVSTYDGSDGYRSIDFTYYCKNGKYISVTYIREDKCGDYGKDSEYTSSGICGYGAPNEILPRGLRVQEQLRILLTNGFKVDTLLISGRHPASGLVDP